MSENSTSWPHTEHMFFTSFTDNSASLSNITSPHSQEILYTPIVLKPTSSLTDLRQCCISDGDLETVLMPDLSNKCPVLPRQHYNREYRHHPWGPNLLISILLSCVMPDLSHNLHGCFVRTFSVNVQFLQANSGHLKLI